MLVTRLRTSYFVPISFRNPNDPIPLCSCGKYDTVYHLLMQCPLYTRARMTMLSTMLIVGKVRPKNFGVPLILGRKRGFFSKYPVLLHFVRYFLKSTGRFPLLK